MLHTRVEGQGDQPLHPQVRIYHLAGAQHFVDRFPPQTSGTRYPANPADFLWILRALLVEMNEWLTIGEAPPESRYPTFRAKTLVAPEDLAFPQIPGVEAPTRSGLAQEAYRADYGPRFLTEGIVDTQPPKLGPTFPVVVPQVDADGNELGGVQLPEVAVPLATYTPWNWRAEGIGAPQQLADFRGAFLPFPRDGEERERSGDPRPAALERYPTRAAYLGQYTEAALHLADEGFLLPEDLPGLLQRADDLWKQVVGEVH